VLAIHLMAGALAAPLAAVLSLAQGSSILVAVGVFGTGGALAILASGLIVALRADRPKVWDR
jgi:hypothetical protein